MGHGELPFKCHICVKSFARSDTLRKHIITHNDNSELHDCEHCEQQFKSNYALVRHVQNKHKGISFSCTICLKSFTLKQTLSMHMKKCKPIEYTKCTVCLKDVDDKKIEKHMKTHDDTQRCEECDTIYASKKAFADHNASVHRQKIDRYCKFCKKCIVQKMPCEPT